MPFYHATSLTADPVHLDKAHCPRCGMPLLVQPQGTTPVHFLRELGDALAYLQQATDLLEAAKGAVDAAVQR